MPDNVRMTDYFYVEVPNKPGEAVKLLAQLKEARVNLLLFSGFPSGHNGQLDFIPEDTAAFHSVAKAHKWKLTGPKKCFLIQGDDRPGATAEVMKKLSDAKINVTAATAIGAGPRYGLVLWVKPSDVDKATRALGID